MTSELPHQESSLTIDFKFNSHFHSVISLECVTKYNIAIEILLKLFKCVDLLVLNGYYVIVIVVKTLSKQPSSMNGVGCVGQVGDKMKNR